MPYTRPVKPTWIDGWQSHRDRSPTSKEPGTDYGCEIGTDVHAPADFIVRETYDGVGPAHGRFVAGDLLDGTGRSFRDMHLFSRSVGVGDRVAGSAVFAKSGATGYGSYDWSNDGTTNGAHVHRSLFRLPWAQARQRLWDTLDPDYYSDKSAPAGGGSSPFPFPTEPLEADVPINFRNINSGVSYTMVPGVSIFAHVNATGNWLSQYMNSGDWPKGLSDEELVDAGVRNLTAEQITWMLPIYGFNKTAGELPPPGNSIAADAVASLHVKADEIRLIHGDTAVLVQTTRPGKVNEYPNGALWDHIAASGGGAAAIDLDALAAKIRIPGTDPAAIAKAVREAFRSDPLVVG